MAGIGFELRRYLDEDSLGGTLKAYGFAALIGSGPWALSVAAVLMIAALALALGGEGEAVRGFTAAVAWLMCVSMVLTGGLQLVFTRFVADRLHEGREHLVGANLLGALVLVALASTALAALLAVTLFELPAPTEIALAANFSVLSASWIVVVVVAGVRRYRLILEAFALAYTAALVLAVALSAFGPTGLLLGVLGGHALLLFLLLGAVLGEYPPPREIRFDFLERGQIRPSLAATGLLVNLGIWADKIVFWSVADTSEPALGPLRVSLVYDLPLFLAHLAVVPGMAVLLLRVETDYAEISLRFFAAVRGRASLAEIERLGDRLAEAVREAIAQICRVQLLTAAALYLAGPALLARLGLSERYLGLFHVALAGVSAEVLMLASLTMLFYLDKRRSALALGAVLCASNVGLSLLSMRLGPAWYGFGFALSMAISAAAGLYAVSRELQRLEHRTFLQAVRRADRASAARDDDAGSTR